MNARACAVASVDETRQEKSVGAYKPIRTHVVFAPAGTNCLPNPPDAHELPPAPILTFELNRGSEPLLYETYVPHVVPLRGPSAPHSKSYGAPMMLRIDPARTWFSTRCNTSGN